MFWIHLRLTCLSIFFLEGDMYIFIPETFLHFIPFCCGEWDKKTIEKGRQEMETIFFFQFG